MIHVTVPGNPIPKQRPRMGKSGVYTPKRTKEYERKVAWAVKKQMKGQLLIGDIAISLEFFRGDKHRCDIDNLQKSVLDALNGVAYEDDSQIVKSSAEKLFDKNNPRVEIRIENSALGASHL